MVELLVLPINRPITCQNVLFPLSLLETIVSRLLL